MPASQCLLDELAAYGPTACTGRPTLAEAEAYCARLARGHYENFTVASLLLPKPLRRHFYNIYAYCRWSDDLADETGDADRSRALLDWWQQQLELCYRGVLKNGGQAPQVACVLESRFGAAEPVSYLQPSGSGQAEHPVFVALASTIETFEIPIEPFADLLTAFRQDQHVSRYETFDDLLGYCRGSANPVGRLVLYLGRCHRPACVELSDKICTGLQLANFCQDVAGDWQRGRVYLPQSSLRAAGVTEAMLDAGVATPQLRSLVAAEVARAEGFLRAGRPLVGLVSPELRLDVDLFVRGGLAILQAIRRADFDVWRTRPKVSRSEQLRLLLASWWQSRVVKHKDVAA